MFWNSHFQIQLNSCLIKEALWAALVFLSYPLSVKTSLKCGSTAKRWFEGLEQMAASTGGASGHK